ncbi:MAG: M48 family metalloprotease, partial [Candidatus Eremiobacteraeota bacterium]|nr:M48 family metalloprotease [Candidatus Eremiobacteraeota bacterium]
MSAPIAQLVDPSRQRLAEALVDRQRPLFFIVAGLEMAALLWMWRSGRAAALRDSLRRTIRSPHLLRLAYVFCLAMIAAVAALPASFISYRVAVSSGLSIQSPAEWLGQVASTAIVDAALAAVIFWAMLTLAERTRLWYVFGVVVLVFFVLLAAFAEPVVLAPWLRHHQTLAEGPLAARLYAVERKAGVNVPITIETIGQGSRADVSRTAGLGPTARIVITDTLMSSATPGELAFVVARESAHIKNGDIMRLELYATLWLIVAAALAVTIADRIGFRRDDDPLSRLALLGTFLGLGILLLLPVVNAYSRRLEARADHAAILTTADPASGVRLLVRIADVNLLPVCPPQIVRRYFLTYPPLGSRI